MACCVLENLEEKLYIIWPPGCKRAGGRHGGARYRERAEGRDLTGRAGPSGVVAMKPRPRCHRHFGRPGMKSAGGRARRLASIAAAIALGLAPVGDCGVTTDEPSRMRSSWLWSTGCAGRRAAATWHTTLRRSSRGRRGSAISVTAAMPSCIIAGGWICSSTRRCPIVMCRRRARAGMIVCQERSCAAIDCKEDEPGPRGANLL